LKEAKTVFVAILNLDYLAKQLTMKSTNKEINTMKKIIKAIKALFIEYGEEFEVWEWESEEERARFHKYFKFAN
jgi:hypothetical protein